MVTSTNAAIDGLLGRVADIRSLVAQQADAASREGHLPRRLVDALHDIGFFRTLVPEGQCGMGLTAPQVIPIVEALARIDAAVAWEATMGVSGLSLATSLHDATTRRAILSRPGAAAGLGSPPTFRFVRVDGGYRVRGAVPAAAASFATWAVVGGTVEAGPGGTPATPITLFAFVPRQAFAVVPAGAAESSALRGVGAHAIVLDDTFVPDACTFVLQGAGDASEVADVCATIPARHAALLAAVAAGAARHAVEALLARATAGAAPRDDAAGAGVSRALALATTAHALVTTAADDIEAAGDGELPLSHEAVRGYRLALVTAAGHAAGAANVAATLAAGFGIDAPVFERCVQDTAAIREHPAFAPGNLPAMGLAVLSASRRSALAAVN